MAAWAAGAEPLTPDGILKELDGLTPVVFLSNTWGLACAESDAAFPEIKGLAADRLADLPLLPDGARVERGALVFTLGAKPAVLGAWNYRNLAPQDRRVSLGVRFDLEVEFEQSAPEQTEWTLTPWFNGQRSGWGNVVAQLKRAAGSDPHALEKAMQNAVYRYSRRAASGAGRHVLRIEDAGPRDKRIRNQASADGLEFEIKGPAGAEIRIHRISVLHKIRTGGFRRAIELPPGPVWQAVGDVDRKTLLVVNGREVPSSSVLSARPAEFVGGWQEVDLKPFLAPGRNVFAVRPAFDADACPLARLSIVMESGEVVEVNTDPSWLCAPRGEPGWDQPGYAGPLESITNRWPAERQFLPESATAVRYGWRPNMLGSMTLPAYGGRMRLLSPDDTQLYVFEGHPFQLRVHVPAGLAGLRPSVEWMLCRYLDGALEPVRSGTAATFQAHGGSLEFELNGDPVPAGVYVIKAVMRGADGVVLEDRIPEPCVVVGHIPMTPARGATMTDGLNLEPEAAIDFTRPDDPAFPWMEMAGTNLYTEPLIVTRNGLTYRETRGDGARPLITYNYEFKQPGDFYLMELDYPDDRPRFLGVALCSEHDGEGDHGKAGPSVWTGIRHLNTGRMQTLSWLFRPDYGYTSITLLNLLGGSTAAASALRIRHVKGRLPELETGSRERAFGILMEHSAGHCGFGKTFRGLRGPQRHAAQPPGGFRDNNRPLVRRLLALSTWLDTCAHYAEYQRWAGQNLICLSFFQYTGTRPNALPDSPVGDQRVVPDINDVAARVFRVNGIEFMTSIGYCSDTMLQARYRTTVADLSQSLLLINAEGVPSRRAPATGYNFNHPEVRRSLLSVIGEAVRKFRALPNFRGVNLVTSFHAPMEAPNYFIEDRPNRGHPLDPLRYDYSDATIARFERDTGAPLPVPPDAPDRFQQRHRLLTSDAWRERWIEWRARNMLAFYLEVRDRMREIKPEVHILTGPDASAGYFLDYATTSGKPALESMREFGWDFRKFHGQDGLYTIPWLHGSGMYSFTMRRGPAHYYEQALKMTRGNTEPDFLKIGDGALNRMAMVHYGWLELERVQQGTLPARPRWQVPFQYTMYGQAQGEAALEPYMQAMEAIDPDSLLYGFTDANLMIGGEQPLREFTRFLRSLPKAKFEPVRGPDAELTVRALRRNGQALFYALNPAPWPVRAALAVEPARRVVNLLTGEACGAPVELVIPGCHGVSFAADGPAEIKGWMTQGTGDLFPAYLEHMRRRKESLAASLADVRVAAALNDGQRTALDAVLREIGTALDGRRPAEAWRRLNGWEVTWCGYLLEKQGEQFRSATEPGGDRPAGRDSGGARD